ncbi:hypothetical protein DL93DRAFT_2061318 [Clavulina sp. PMI_390]|nr:hypothetical protein DL93DRAFT_2061318 [Clavulina sp. PMI_390]
MDENHRTLMKLFNCIEEDNCEPNQGKVVILNSYHFKGGLWGWTSGEDIWCIAGLKNMGYSYLYAAEIDRAVTLYQMFPDLVRGVLMEDGDVTKCFENTLDCVKSDVNLDGIPVWKLFSFYFWASPNHPLGSKWTLSPENYTTEWEDNTNTYLGYSVELSCLSHPDHPEFSYWVPPDERPEGQAYIFAKRQSYFAPQRDLAFPLSFWDRAAKRTGVRFVAGAENDKEERARRKDMPKLDGEVPEVLPESITNYGLLPQSDFVDAIAHSRLLVGVGNPIISPTPYEALCLGVPFINPILRWDTKNPMNRREWDSQHAGLKWLDPPYVYNVFKDDEEGFLKAIEAALSTPIESYILPRMTMAAVEGRLSAILEADWKKEAELVLEERRRQGSGAKVCSVLSYQWKFRPTSSFFVAAFHAIASPAVPRRIRIGIHEYFTFFHHPSSFFHAISHQHQ